MGEVAALRNRNLRGQDAREQPARTRKEGEGQKKEGGERSEKLTHILPEEACNA